MLRSPWTMGITSQFRDRTSSIVWSFPIIYPISCSLKAHFSLFWQLPKAIPVDWWQSTIHFTTLPYWIDHGAGPNITSMLVLVSCWKERSGVTTVVLLHWCQIVACIHYSNMFFYIRKPDGANDDQLLACLGDQPWTFLLYLQLLLFKQYNMVAYNGVLMISNRQNRQNGHDIRPSLSTPHHRRYGLLKCQC